MNIHTHWRRLCVTVVCTPLVAVLLTLAGCEETMSSPKSAEPETEAPAEPEPTATELLAGKYEVTAVSWECSGEGCEPERKYKTYIDPVVLHADGTVTVPHGIDEIQGYDRWSFYPERRALTLMVDPLPPVELEGIGTPLVLSQEWRTGDPLCLLFGTTISGDTVCDVELQRKPAPADGGQTIKTPPVTQDDQPPEWVGTYESSIVVQDGEITSEVTLTDDGVVGYSWGSEPAFVVGYWWFDASIRALALIVTNRDVPLPGGSIAYVFPEGWDGESICVSSLWDSTGCGITLKRK